MPISKFCTSIWNLHYFYHIHRILPLQKSDIYADFLEWLVVYHMSFSFFDMAAISSAISSEESLM